MRSLGALLSSGIMVAACAGPSAENANVAPAPIATIRVQPAGSSQPIAVAHDAPPPVALATPWQSDPAHCRDSRKNAQTPRLRPLLQSETQGLERLLQATPMTARDRPAIIFRLAEGYDEIASAAIRDGSPAPEIASARAQAIAYYKDLKDNYPTDPRIDEVAYFLGLAQELSGDTTSARRSYYDLVRTSPSSKLIPYAYLAFGEMFFEEAHSDPPKWDLAIAAYSEALKYPPPANPIWGYAQLKMARVQVEKGDLAPALGAYAKVLEFSAQYPQTCGASEVGTLAQIEITPVYAKTGDPARAYVFFNRIYQGSNDVVLKTMESLGALYLDQGHFPEAAVLYADLSARDRARVCKWQAYSKYAKSAVGAGTAPSPATLTSALAICPK